MLKLNQAKSHVENLIIKTIYIICLILIFDMGIYSYIQYHDLRALIFFGSPFIPALHYVGQVMSFIIFGSFMLLLTHRFRLLGIPIFIITYVFWEISIQGLSIIHTAPNYYLFYVALASVIPSIYIILKRTKINLAKKWIIMYLLFGTPMGYYLISNWLVPIFNEVLFICIFYFSIYPRLPKSRPTIK